MGIFCSYYSAFKCCRSYGERCEIDLSQMTSSNSYYLTNILSLFQSMTFISNFPQKMTIITCVYKKSPDIVSKTPYTGGYNLFKLYEQGSISELLHKDIRRACLRICRSYLLCDILVIDKVIAALHHVLAALVLDKDIVAVPGL